MVHLPLDYRQQRTGHFLGSEAIVVRFAQCVDGISDWSQRVPQLVRQHR
jgi:hypothetical protein